jgi:hypothetical protein
MARLSLLTGGLFRLAKQRPSLVSDPAGGCLLRAVAARSVSLTK